MGAARGGVLGSGTAFGGVLGIAFTGVLGAAFALLGSPSTPSGNVRFRPNCARPPTAAGTNVAEGLGVPDLGSQCLLNPTTFSGRRFPQEELDKARTHGLAEADRLLRQDRQPVWASSQKFQDVRKRIKLSQQFVEAAERARKEAEQAASPTMPDQLNGKILTATLKNGKPLCPDFQQDACPNDADTCPFGAHLCAVLQQSGRACGGKHGAAVCRIKRAVLATTPAPVVSS